LKCVRPRQALINVRKSDNVSGRETASRRERVDHRQELLLFHSTCIFSEPYFLNPKSIFSSHRSIPKSLEMQLEIYLSRESWRDSVKIEYRPSLPLTIMPYSEYSFCFGANSPF
jgi:hypothetical protein